MCKGFTSSCAVEIQVAFRMQNYIHSAFQPVLLPLLSSPAAPMQPGQGSLDAAAATANTEPLLTRQSQAPWSKDVCKSPKEDPTLLQGGTQQGVPQGNA